MIDNSHILFTCRRLPPTPLADERFHMVTTKEHVRHRFFLGAKRLITRTRDLRDAHLADTTPICPSNATILRPVLPVKIVAGTNQGRIYRVRMDTLASIVISENHRGSVTCVSYARGVSDRFATASVDGTVRVWDTADYGVLTTAVVRDAGEPLCLVLTQVRIHACAGRREGSPIDCTCRVVEVYGVCSIPTALGEPGGRAY